MRLNLGCGYDHRDGYLNVDFLERHRPDLVADVLQLPLADGCASEVLAQDVLEHLPRTSTTEALTEWRRVTALDGFAHIRVPSLLHAADLMRREGTIEMHRLLLQNLYGTQAYTGDVHLTSFTDLTITTDLHAAGWGRVEGQLLDGWLWDVTAQAAAGPAVGVFWGEHLYAPEGEGTSRFRWAGEHGRIGLVNVEPDPLEVRVTAHVFAGHARRGSVVVRTEDGTALQRVKLGHDLDVRVVVQAGRRVELQIDPDVAAVDAPGDARDLRVQLITPDLTFRTLSAA